MRNIFALHVAYHLAPCTHFRRWSRIAIYKLIEMTQRTFWFRRVNRQSQSGIFNFIKIWCKDVIFSKSHFYYEVDLGIFLYTCSCVCMYISNNSVLNWATISLNTIDFKIQKIRLFLNPRILCFISSRYVECVDVPNTICDKLRECFCISSFIIFV